MIVPKNSVTITKQEGAQRQIDGAICALVRGEFEIAVTLAGAAEGMLDRDGPHLFSRLRDAPLPRSKMDERQWTALLNLERDWLKHSREPATLTIVYRDAAFMIARAATKLENWTPLMEEFKIWLLGDIAKGD